VQGVYGVWVGPVGRQERKETIIYSTVIVIPPGSAIIEKNFSLFSCERTFTVSTALSWYRISPKLKNEDETRRL
jgi:hypothetical protein